MFHAPLSYAELAEFGVANHLNRLCRVRWTPDDEVCSSYGTLQSIIREIRRCRLVPCEAILSIELASDRDAFHAAARLAGYPDELDQPSPTADEVARVMRMADAIRNGTYRSPDDEPFTNAEFDAE